MKDSNNFVDTLFKEGEETFVKSVHDDVAEEHKDKKEKISFTKAYILPVWKALVFIIRYCWYLFVLFIILLCRPVGLSEDILDVSENHPEILTYFIIKSLAIYAAIIGTGCLGYSMYLMWGLIYFEKGLFFLYVAISLLAVCDIFIIAMASMWELVSNEVMSIYRYRRKNVKSNDQRNFVKSVRR